MSVWTYIIPKELQRVLHMTNYNSIGMITSSCGCKSAWFPSKKMLHLRHTISFNLTWELIFESFKNHIDLMDENKKKPATKIDRSTWFLPFFTVPKEWYSEVLHYTFEKSKRAWKNLELLPFLFCSSSGIILSPAFGLTHRETIFMLRFYCMYHGWPEKCTAENTLKDVMGACLVQWTEIEPES